MEYFQVTTDLLNSDNIKVAITQLCNELHVCNFYFQVTSDFTHYGAYCKVKK